MPPTFAFALDSFEIDNTLSKHEDTDYVVFTIRAGNSNSYFLHKALGNVNNGVHQIGLSPGNISVDQTDSVLINYLIVNAGSASAADVDQAMQLTAGKLAAGDLPGLPRLSSLTIEFADWFKQQLGAILKSPCDGVVAAEQNTFTYSDLVSRTSQPPFFTQRTSHSGPIPGPDCNSRPSLYVVDWSMKQFVVVPPVTKMDFKAAQQQLAAVPLQAQQIQVYPNMPGDWVTKQNPAAQQPATINQYVELYTMVAP